jgi:hypothetical protein
VKLRWGAVFGFLAGFLLLMLAASSTYSGSDCDDLCAVYFIATAFWASVAGLVGALIGMAIVAIANRL